MSVNSFVGNNTFLFYLLFMTDGSSFARMTRKLNCRSSSIVTGVVNLLKSVVTTIENLGN